MSTASTLHRKREGLWFDHPDQPALPAPRQHCARCLRPQSVQHNACICRWVRQVDVNTRVLILQHPLEVNNPKGSARLLHLSLPGSSLITGEAFDADRLRDAIAGGADARSEPDWQAVLLYPAEANQPTYPTYDTYPTPSMRSTHPAHPISSICTADARSPVAPGLADALQAPAAVSPTHPVRVCLVVLDGTWRKSRKMLQRNPLLQALPRLSLKPLAPSRYSVRKAHQPHQRSTLEAACAALAQLESDSDKFSLLLAAFDGFVAQQLGFCAGPPASGAV